jgi:hypothetical protein
MLNIIVAQSVPIWSSTIVDKKKTACFAKQKHVVYHKVDDSCTIVIPFDKRRAIFIRYHIIMWSQLEWGICHLIMHGNYSLIVWICVIKCSS